MTGYTRFWDCERCGKRQESMDRPDFEVCEACIGAQIVVTRRLDTAMLYDIATRAYERGYEHGKAVAEKAASVTSGTGC